jgi:hypothetical protein
VIYTWDPFDPLTNNNGEERSFVFEAKVSGVYVIEATEFGKDNQPWHTIRAVVTVK